MVLDRKIDWFSRVNNICSIHGFVKEWISWVHLNFSLFATQYSSWSYSHGFYYTVSFEQLSNKIDISFKKRRKEGTCLVFGFDW